MEGRLRVDWDRGVSDELLLPSMLPIPRTAACNGQTSRAHIACPFTMQVLPLLWLRGRPGGRCGLLATPGGNSRAVRYAHMHRAYIACAVRFNATCQDSHFGDAKRCWFGCQ